ncbi:hypothetical protein BDY24DRAFT_419250 [Mrakia frigida]|uniref:uncharacterized protein n=1 Tax=Mrakia frigida TaxID=29902 RepID=UPI003FCBF11D
MDFLKLLARALRNDHCLSKSSESKHLGILNSEGAEEVELVVSSTLDAGSTLDVDMKATCSSTLLPPIHYSSFYQSMHPLPLRPVTEPPVTTRTSNLSYKVAVSSKTSAPVPSPSKSSSRVEPVQNLALGVRKSRSPSPMSRARRESQREEEARKRAWSRSRDSRAFGDGHGSVRVSERTNLNTRFIADNYTPRNDSFVGRPRSRSPLPRFERRSRSPPSHRLPPPRQHSPGYGNSRFEADSFSSLPVIGSIPSTQVSPSSTRPLTINPSTSPSLLLSTSTSSKTSYPSQLSSRPQVVDNTTIGLSQSATSIDLEKLLSPFGKITAITIKAPTGKETRGKAYVSFELSSTRNELYEQQLSLVLRNNHLKLFRASARNHHALHVEPNPSSSSSSSVPVLPPRAIAGPPPRQPTILVPPPRAHTPREPRAQRVATRPVLEASGIASLLTNIRLTFRLTNRSNV